MNFNLFMFSFQSFFNFEKPLIFHSFYQFLLFLWFRYLKKHVKESFIYLSSQFFFETSHKTLKLYEKLERVGKKEQRKVRKSVRNAFSRHLSGNLIQKCLFCCPPLGGLGAYLTEIVN